MSSTLLRIPLKDIVLKGGNVVQMRYDDPAPPDCRIEARDLGLGLEDYARIKELKVAARHNADSIEVNFSTRHSDGKVESVVIGAELMKKLGFGEAIARGTKIDQLSRALGRLPDRMTDGNHLSPAKPSHAKY